MTEKKSQTTMKVQNLLMRRLHLAQKKSRSNAQHFREKQLRKAPNLWSNDMSPFQRTVENFVCEHCGFSVKGNGYTNHCPRCLWSKHVDIHPGDRAENCGGLMEPIRIEGTDKYRVVHACSKCKNERINDISSDDNTEEILAIVKKHGE